MKQKITIAAAAAGLALSAVISQASLNFAGINNAQFNASRNTFQLNPIAGSIAAGTGMISGNPFIIGGNINISGKALEAQP